MIPNANEIRIFCVVNNCEWKQDTIRCAYEAIVASWAEAGTPPNRLAAVAPSVGSGWKTFKPRDRRLRRGGFEGVEYFSLSYLAQPNDSYPNPDWLYPDRDWLAYATISIRRENAVLSWIPAIIGGPSRGFFDLFREIANLGRARCGYRYLARYNAQHFSDEPLETTASRDASMNSSWWRPHSPEQTGSLLLRNVYPENFLSRPYLDAPIGYTSRTLEEWIKIAPEERGVIEPFTDKLVNWKPPPQNIPKIREDLYRAGRVFYWRFFCPAHHIPGGGESPEPLYRLDPRQPWEAPEPIPEIFQADYYKNVEKGLTYQLPLQQD